MNELIGMECDYYIQKCKKILDTKNTKEAIQVKPTFRTLDLNIK